MIQSTKKGAVLIVVTMIVLILSLLATGLFVIVGNDSKLASQDFNDAKLRFAAEGGIKAMYHNLCRLTPDEIGKEESKVKVGDSQVLTINDFSVNTKAAKRNGELIWDLEATATDANGKQCTISLTNIIGSTVLENSMVISSSMKETGTFVGPVNKLADGSLQRGTNVDHFRGKTYFGGDINIGGIPWFEGNCTYAAKSTDQVASKHNGSNSGWIADINNMKHKGITDAGYNSAWAGNAFGTSQADYSKDVNMEARFNKMFENGSYNISDAPVDFAKSNYEWSDLRSGNNLPADLTVKNLTAGNDDKIRVDFSVDANDKPWATINGGGIPQKIDLTTCKVITIRTNNTESDVKQEVLIKGVIGSDITLAVDRGVVKLVGDLYYKGFEGFKNMKQSELVAEGANTKLKQINTKLNSGEYGKFGLINYDGHVLVDKETNEKQATGATGSASDDALLFMGAIYAPNGQFGSAAKGPNGLIYNNYGMNDNRIETGFLQVATIGSVITKGKAYYKASSQTAGMAAHFNPDPRYEAGLKPSGFPVTVKELTYGSDKFNFYQYSTTEMIWKIEWK